jgi:hypothetical protein
MSAYINTYIYTYVCIYTYIYVCRMESAADFEASEYMQTHISYTCRHILELLMYVFIWCMSSARGVVRVRLYVIYCAFV